MASSNSGTTPFGPVCQKATLMRDCQSTEHCWGGEGRRGGGGQTDEKQRKAEYETMRQESVKEKWNVCTNVKSDLAACYVDIKHVCVVVCVGTSVYISVLVYVHGVFCCLSV